MSSMRSLPQRAHMQRALRGLYHGVRIGNGRHVTYADNRCVLEDACVSAPVVA